MRTRFWLSVLLGILIVGNLILLPVTIPKVKNYLDAREPEKASASEVYSGAVINCTKDLRLVLLYDHGQTEVRMDEVCNVIKNNGGKSVQ